MAISFNAAKKQTNELIESKRLDDWQLDDAQLETFFKINKENPEPDLQRIDEEIKKLKPTSAEFYIGNLVIGGVANPPSRAGGGLVRERTFVSDDQKAHYELSRRALKEINEAIKNSKTCQALHGLKRKCKNKNGKEVEKAIEITIHARNTEAVLDSYVDEESKEEAAPSPQPQPQPQE